MTMHRMIGALALGAILAGAGTAAAQEPGQGPGMRDEARQEIMEQLYPIGLVKAHKDELKLTDEQVDKLRKLVRDARAEVGQLMLDVQKESEKLVDLLRAGASKEQVYAQLDRIFPIENKIKKKHLGLLICVRDVLTTEQRKALDMFKRSDADRGWPGRGHGRMGPPPGGFGQAPGGPGGPPGPPPGPGPGPGQDLDDSF
ncbi:MAG: Spy/CpxP family protein refolding chaperone [Deltaproteobacteria bacterium]|nr:Spy/CpxP family protein refolding chaperone [Deltaproteobacteria bacterium]